MVFQQLGYSRPKLLDNKKFHVEKVYHIEDCCDDGVKSGKGRRVANATNIHHCVKKNTPCKNTIILIAWHMPPRGPLKIPPSRTSSLVGYLSIIHTLLDNYMAVTLTIDGCFQGISARVCLSRYWSTNESDYVHLSGSNTCKKSKRSCPKDLRVP